MTSSQLSIKEHLLDRLRKIKKTQRVSDSRARLRDCFRESLLGHPTFFKKAFVTASLFNWIQIRALKILNESKLEHLLVIDVFNNDRKFLKTCKFRSLVPTFTSDNLISSTVLPNQQRLQDTIFFNRVTELTKLSLIKVRTRLIRIRFNLVDRNRHVSSGIARITGFCLSLSHQSIQTTTKTLLLLRTRHGESLPLRDSYTPLRLYCWEHR